ncbi:hypothetical protein KIN20_021440 [Parelaphostrongylus tenuis]|uniref:Uncharacterized protein n=1 Tax=Parelaphostrongylus tenuis TaxID=148309 RepID=A0AAD5N4F3_PARTN|nr:hypothetical protein KIN20_021440 [Parelaphostrongylus tenuis]
MAVNLRETILITLTSITSNLPELNSAFIAHKLADSFTEFYGGYNLLFAKETE